MKNVKFVTIIVLTLVIISLSSVGYLLIRNQEETGTDTVYLSDAEMAQVLKGVLLNNTQASLSNSEPGGRYTETISSRDLVLTNLLPYTELKSYNFQKEVFSAGPAIDQCPVYRYSSLDNYTSEIYTFYNGEKYLFKNVTTDNSGNIVSYYLENGEYIIEYRGGQYAVQIASENSDIGQSSKVETYDETTTEPTDIPDEPVDVDDSIDQFFGDNVKVEQVEENGEIIEYIVTWEYKNSCSDISYIGERDGIAEVELEDNDGQLMINKLWIDAESFNIKKETLYLENDNQENEIYSRSMTTESSDSDFNEIADIFTYELDVELREFEFETEVILDPYNEEDRTEFIAQLKDILRENKVDFLTMTDNQLVSVYAAQMDSFEVPEYLLDRDFYPSGDEGDKLYNEAIETYKPDTIMEEYQSIITTGFENGVDISIFGKPIDEIEYIQEFFMSEGQEVDGIKIEINGKTYDAKVFEVSTMIESVEVSVKKPVEDIEEYKPSEEYKSFVISFEFNGGYYLLSGDAEDYVTDGKLSLSSYSYDDKTDMTKFEELLTKTFEEMVYDGDEENSF